jgi:Exopolysaccharide synthesis, ExoD.
MELVPMSANVAGIALLAFGLALIARDGLLALIAFISVTLLAGLLIYKFL